jgi:hypothetical protein
MRRRLVVAGLAAVIVGPALSVGPGSAAVLFSCTSGSGGGYLQPGLGSTPVYQTDVSSSLSISGCSNGETASVGAGSASGFSTVKSGPGAPNKTLSCFTNYPNNTLIMAGFTDPSFGINWGLGGSSSGIAKLKASGTVNVYKAVLVITAGKYVAPAGQKTKLKGSFTGSPVTGSCTDSDPSQLVSFGNNGDIIVQQT